MSSIRKPVLSIDLGATYTKVSFRPEWPANSNNFEDPSAMVAIEGQTITPTLVFDSGRGDSFFGNTAAGLKPADGDVVHNSWKRDLFNAVDEHARAGAVEVAGRFLGWLRKEIEAAGVPVNDARVRICVPAFDGKAMLSDLAGSMRENGWENAEIFRASEPVANAVGMLSGGKNWLVYSRQNRQFNCVFTEMFGNNSPLIRAARNHAQFGENPNRIIALLDIGSYTTDLALVPWNADGRDGFVGDAALHKSFRHGVIDQLDQTVFADLGTRHGIDFSHLEFQVKETLKKTVYGRDLFRLALEDGSDMVEIGDEQDQETVAASAKSFVETLWGKFIEPELRSSPPDWVVLTGGGNLIRSIKNQLVRKFERLETQCRQVEPEDDDQGLLREATAMGGSSVILDWLAIETGAAGPIGSFIEERNVGDGNEPCPCRGGNKDCMRCSGQGYYRPTRGDVRERPFDVVEETPLVAQTEVVEELPTVPKTSIAPSPTLPPSERTPVQWTQREIESVIANAGGKMLEEFTLRGWMGELVFPDLNRYVERDDSTLCGRLLDVDSARGRADWYRLLCLGCLLGAPVTRSRIRTFWNETLNRSNFWEATIPDAGVETNSGNSQKQIDEFFEELIHREFKSQSASGEDAELLRRVFYDFRKMHFYVFNNQLPAVFLEVIGFDHHYETPIRFLKSGHSPGARPWRGVIGQSMTSPLLFLMRELARIGMIDRTIYHPVCFYMNGPARRAATALGWIDPQSINQYDFESILEASRKVHKKMAAESPQWLDWFDLPLQQLGTHGAKAK